MLFSSLPVIVLIYFSPSCFLLPDINKHTNKFFFGVMYQFCQLSQICFFVSIRDMEAPRLEGGRINLDAPRFDQSTFLGRAKHFFTVTDPRNILRTAKELDDAKELLIQYRYVDTVFFYFDLIYHF